MAVRSTESVLRMAPLEEILQDLREGRAVLVVDSSDREKIRGGLRRACEKRPVSTETIDAAVEAIERKLQEMCLREVDSRIVGEAVIEELRKMDKIAYVRFASVYREFSDVSQFVDALESLRTSGQAQTHKKAESE